METTLKVKPCGCKGKITCQVCESLLEKVPRQPICDFNLIYDMMHEKESASHSFDVNGIMTPAINMQNPIQINPNKSTSTQEKMPVMLQSHNAVVRKSDNTKSLLQDSTIAISSSKQFRTLPKFNIKQIMENEVPFVKSTDVAQVFVRGRCIGEPLASIKSAHFTKEIHSNLYKLNYRDVYRVQGYSWQHLMEGRSVAIINGEKSGKTFAYLPAILSILKYEEDNAVGQGPVAIIILRSSRDVEMIFKCCQRLLSDDSLRIVKAYGKWNLENNMIDLMNGCHLLITTPPCFERLNNTELLQMFDKTRIKHLIFDEIDSIAKRFPNEVNTIIKCSTRGYESPELNPQLIVTSTSWDKLVEKFMTLSCNPMILIGAHIEAAIYTGCMFNMEKYANEEKSKKLIEFLEDELYNCQKTIIVVNNQNDIDELQQNFLKHHIEHSILTSKSLREHIQMVTKSWVAEKSGRMTVLVLTDDVVAASNINCAQVLIHYSLPPTWTLFSQRFVLSFDYYKCYLSKKECNIDLTTDVPRVKIMLDDTNLLEIPHLVNFMIDRKLISEVPPIITDFVKKIVEEREKQKHQVVDGHVMPVCNNVMQFGKCSKNNLCQYRHVFIAEDKPVNVPVDGRIKFKLIRVLNPSHFIVKIVEFIPKNEITWISCAHKNEHIEKELREMQSYFEENAIVRSPIKIDDTCGVFLSKTWYRCKVLDVESTRKSRHNVNVLLIDDGRQMFTRSTELMELPANVKHLEPLVSDLRVVNLVPYDSDEVWDHESAMVVEELLVRKVSGDFMSCNVMMTIGNVIFTENLEIREFKTLLNVEAIKYSLKEDLLSKEICSLDLNVENILKNLAKNCSLLVAEKSMTPSQELCNYAPVVVSQEVALTRWKQLTWTSTYEVLIKHFETPNNFYVTIAETNNMTLKILMKKIEMCAEKSPLTNKTIGTLCLIVQEISMRGRIHEINKNGTFNIFLMDVGFIINCADHELYELPASCINALPFQAVQCNLVGVKPRFGRKQWARRSLQSFKHFIVERINNKSVPMYVISSSAEGKYNVLLYDPSTSERFDFLSIREKLADSANDEEIPAATQFPEKSLHVSEPNSLNDEEQSPFANLNLGEIDFEFDQNDVRELLGVPRIERSLGVPRIEREHQRPTSPTRKDNKEIVCNSGLKYFNKHPQIEWRQNDLLVYLTILATNCVSYALEMDDSSLKILIKSVNDDRETWESATLHFFGCAEPQMSSHQLIGQYIVIRIVKSIAHKDWPRLTLFAERNTNIHQNFDSIELPVDHCKETPAYHPCPAGASDDLSNLNEEVLTESDGEMISDELF